MRTEKQQNRGNLLITGATGFIGSFLVKEALQRGYRVFGAVRSESEHKLMTRQQVVPFPFDLTRPEDLKRNLANFRDKGIEFDYVIHAAAVNRPKKIEEFYSGNGEFTPFFANELSRSHQALKKFIFISSMAALGPGDPETFTPITEENEPNPTTPYGISKRQAEVGLNGMDDLNFIIFRPTAVYGPRDTKFLMRVMDMMQKGIEVRIGSTEQRSSFIYVKDLVGFIFNSLEKDVSREVFNVSDGRNYSQVELNQIVRDALGVDPVPVRIPTWLMMGLSYGMLIGNRIINKPLHLSPYKVREITALNWIIDISSAREKLGYTPQYDLETGIHETVEWYQNGRK